MLRWTVAGTVGTLPAGACATGRYGPLGWLRAPREEQVITRIALFAVAQEMEDLDGEPAGDPAIDHKSVGIIGMDTHAGKPWREASQVQMAQQGGEDQPEARELAYDEVAIVALSLV